MSLPRPHDLLWGLPAIALPEHSPVWARQVLTVGMPVVVRRAQCAFGWVAVGVRGQGREQRLGVCMRLADMQRQLGPEALRWQGESAWPALQALASAAPVLDSTGLAWGPTGAVGYQLATGSDVLHLGSDLDLVLRTPTYLARGVARDLLDILERGPCRIDVQLETPAGAIALREWASGATRVLLKSSQGARLLADPWQAAEQAA